MLGSWEHDRNKLFLDDKDRERFLERLKRIVQDFEVRLFAFCLMSNHFHSGENRHFQTVANNLWATIEKASKTPQNYDNLRAVNR